MKKINICAERLLLKTSDLNDSQFRGLINSICVTALLEKEPNKSQLCKHVPIKILNFLIQTDIFLESIKDILNQIFNYQKNKALVLERKRKQRESK